LNFRQKKSPPKNTLFISLKVAHSAQEAAKKNSARWLIKKLKTIEVGFNGIGCAAALLYQIDFKISYQNVYREIDI
jgi:hypothetical protein